MAKKCNLVTRFVFIAPLVMGVIVILFCFISCPMVWLKLPKEQTFNYRMLLFIVPAISLWTLIMACGFFWWRWRTPHPARDDLPEGHNLLPNTRHETEAQSAV